LNRLTSVGECRFGTVKTRRIRVEPFRNDFQAEVQEFERHASRLSFVLAQGGASNTCVLGKLGLGHVSTCRTNEFVLVQRKAGCHFAIMAHLCHNGTYPRAAPDVP